MSIKEKVKHSNDILSVIHLYKFIITILLIIIILLSGALFYSLKKQQLVVSVDNEKFSETLPVISNNMGNLVAYKQFITTFLNLLYCWDYETRSENIKQATYYMTNSAIKDYQEELVEKGRSAEDVEEYKLTNVLTRIQIIDVQTIKKGEYQAKIRGLKLKIHDFIARPIPVEITLGFKLADISKYNYWGLEIYKFKEVNLE